jgi:hypothetical protein
MGPWANQSYTDRGNVTQCDRQQLSDRTMTMYYEIHLNNIFLSPVTQQLRCLHDLTCRLDTKEATRMWLQVQLLSCSHICKCKKCNSLWNVHDIKQTNSRAHLLLLTEYPANINFSILTRSDHNFNIRTAATFYNNASTTVQNSLL